MASLGLRDSAQLLKKEFIEIEGVEELINKTYRKLLVENNEVAGIRSSFEGGSMSYNDADINLGRVLRREVRKVLFAVQKEMRNKAKSIIKNDPGKAYKAVKKANWKKEIGGSVSLYNPKVVVKSMRFKLGGGRRSGRGGNRRKASDRTKQLYGYEGVNRAFVLRFLNEGAEDRHINFTPHDNPKRVGARTVRKNTGNRGSISARGFFRDSEGVMRAKVGEMTETLERFINSVGTM